MKKLLIVSVIGILILSSIGSLVVSKNTDDSMITQSVFELSISNILIGESDQFISLDIEEANSVLMEPNKPKLPCIIETYTFPLGIKIEGIQCKPLNIQTHCLSKLVEPSAQPVLLDGSTPKERPIISYGIDLYPNKWFDYDVGSGLYEGERCIIVKIQYYPVQYHPSDGIIQVAGDFETSIYLEEQYITPKITVDEQYDFIILTPSKFIGPLLPFSQHKINRGITTKIVSLSEIYNSIYFNSEGRDNPEKIKYFIRNAIEQWDTNFVLLIGGIGEFPTRDTHILVEYDPEDLDDEIFVSDVYYADIYDSEHNFASWDTNKNDIFGEFNWSSAHHFDDVDLYPDIYLGRLPILDDVELDGVINKIILYENNEAYKQDWFSEIMVIGGDTIPGPLDDTGVDEGEYINQYILDIMTGFSADKVWDSNYRLSWINPSGVDNINNGFADGRGFVDWAGHGSPTVWTTYPHDGTHQSLPTPTGLYRNNQILALENRDKLPIVVIGACSTGKFDVIDCFAWSFVKNPDGGGIASLGTTGLSWGCSGEETVDWLGGRMHVSFYEAYKSGADTFGQMWADGVTRYIRPNMDAGHHKTGEQWEPFGDPTLQIAVPSNPPIKPSIPIGPTDGKKGEEFTYMSVATDPDGDDIYYRWNWDDGMLSTWIGPYNSGEVCEINHVWDEKGNFQITVQAKDINGKLGEWSDPLTLSLTRSKNIFDWFFDFLQIHDLFSFLQEYL